MKKFHLSVITISLWDYLQDFRELRYCSNIYEDADLIGAASNLTVVSHKNYSIDMINSLLPRNYFFSLLGDFLF